MSKSVVKEVDLLRNCWTCAECGGKTQVYSTRPPFRYRRCLTCNTSYRTQEVHQDSADVLLRFVDLARETFDHVGMGTAG